MLQYFTLPPFVWPESSGRLLVWRTPPGVWSKSSQSPVKVLQKSGQSPLKEENGWTAMSSGLPQDFDWTFGKFVS